VPDRTSGTFTDSRSAQCSGGGSTPPPPSTAPGGVTSAKIVSGPTTDKATSVVVKYRAASGPVTDYRITVVDRSTPAQADTTVTAPASELRVKVSELLPGHDYAADITALNGDVAGQTVTTAMSATAR
jgi:Fibronectin type III domain